MMQRGDARFACMLEQLGVQIMTLVRLGLLNLHGNAMRLGPGVLPDAGHLPGDFHVRLVRPDGEHIVVDLGSHDGMGKLADRRQLIAEIAVQRFEPAGQRDRGVAPAVGDDGAVVDVFHVRGFDEGVIQVLVGRVQRMVDLERSAGLGKIAVHQHIAVFE
jgi:hypothetical protein